MKNVLVRDLVVKDVLPFANLGCESESPLLYDVPDRTLADVLTHYLKMSLYGAYRENKASENSARVAAMDQASRNAGEMMDNITREYNRKRQSCITGELIEITSGAEVLKQ